MKALKQADFSRETDLKERLFRQLFAESGGRSGRTVLRDEEVAELFAAGAPQSAERSFGKKEPKTKE